MRTKKVTIIEVIACVDYSNKLILTLHNLIVFFIYRQLEKGKII